MTSSLAAQYRERQLLTALVLALFLAFAWCADHYGRTAAGCVSERLAVVMEGVLHQ